MAKNIVNLNVDGTVYTSRPFGTCSTAAATTAKEVSCADFALVSGATILVKFTYANTASSPTLNVNSTGAKNIYYRGAALASSLYYWGAGDLVEFYYDGTQWNLLNVSNSDNNTYPSAYCTTAAGTAAKTASCTNYVATSNTYLHVVVVYANSSAGAITLNVNGKGAKPIYINGVASSSTNYALPAGSYIVYYDGTNYQFRTDGILPGKILKASDADTVNGKTVLSDVPANAKFTDTNTKVTSVGNHYEPESTSEDTLSIDASDATTSASWGSTNLVTGIDILRDAKGHVTGINVDSIKMPGNPNTTYSAGKGLTLSSTTFNVGAGNGIAVADDTVSANLRSTTKLTNDSAAATETSGRIYPVALDKSGYLAVNVPWKNDDTIYGADRGITLVNSKYGHSNTAITAKTAFVDTDADASISVATNGGSFKVTDVIYDAYGHITGSQDRTITLSESKKGTVTSITLTQGDGITVSSSGTAITSSGTRTISLNTATDDAIGGIKVGYTTSGKNYKVQLDSNNNAYVNVPWTDNNDDTKNTAGTIEKLDTKLFLVGAASQGANPQTYSNSKVYIGTNNCLYSNGTKVSVEGHTHSQYLTEIPSHTHSYTELTGSVADAANQAIVSDGTANGWKLYSLKSAAQKTATTSVSSSSTDSQVPTAKAVYTAITSGIKANDAMIFKGTLGTSGTITALPASHKIGDTYRVTTAGSYAGVQCEVGDLVICITAGTAANNAHWTVAQTNIDGAVTGPASSTDGRVALFSGTSGKVLKQSSYTIGKSVPSDAVFTDTVYTHPDHTQITTAGLYKITTNSTGHITAATAVVKADITALGIPSTNTTYAVADYDTAGLIMPLKSYSIACTFGSSASTASTAVTVNSISTTSNRYYAIEMDKNGRAFVNVPWEDNDTNTKVNVTLATTSKAYLVGVTSTPTSTATAMTAVSDTGVYLDTTAGMLTATTFKGALEGNASSADYASSAGNADTLDNYHASSFGIWRGNVQTDPEADDTTYTTTADFLKQIHARSSIFNSNFSAFRGSWYYVGNVNYNTGVGSLDMAGTAVLNISGNSTNDVNYKSLMFLDRNGELFSYVSQESGVATWSKYAKSSEIKNATITIKQAGTSKGSFTLNQSSNVTIELTDSNTNTTYSAGSGLSLSGTTFNHASSVTAGTAGTSSATSGSTLAVPYVTVNATGHVTGYGTHTHTVNGFLPSSGGTITGTLQIKRTGSAIQYLNSSGTVWGWMGYDDENKATVWNSDGSTKYTLLHSGNYTSYAPSLNHGYGYVMKATTIDASSLDANTYYPVIIPTSPYNKASIRIEIEVSLNSGTKPSWSTHNSGFSVRKVWETNGSGWGTSSVSRRIIVSTYNHASSDPVRGLGQMTNSSNEYVYVRGGGKYFFYTSHGVTPSLKTSTYTSSSQSVSPTTTAPAAIGESYSYAGHTHSQYLTAMPEHTHAYLPTAGGNMTSGARIGGNGGNLYIGNSNNAGWLMVQDICSQSSAGDTYWSLRTNGTAHFTTLYLGGEQITFTT